MQGIRRLTPGCFLLFALLAPTRADVRDTAPVDFDRDIRPILSNNCFKCHGPDEAKRVGGLRLDTREGQREELKSGNRAVVPGKSAESALVARITASDSATRMPPTSTGKVLSKDQVDLFLRWTEEGAEWRPHWSFEKPNRPPLPAVQDEGWVRTPIDRFVLARLETDGLRPSPGADKVTLIRRLTFDLTGLPPTPAEVDAFLADTRPNAYDRLIDRLLESPRYGEHMARYWLDAVRYGDSHGLHFDNERSLWPYRDWVIGAFNKNLPFDQFTVEQLAGDLLPNPTRDQIIATGFNRCNVTTSEGGSIDEEVLVRYAVDRTEAVSTIFLGLTLGCAVCHEHKFDPITQKEFYGLYAFFNSAADRAMDGNSLLPPPVLKLSTPEQEARLKVLDDQIALGRGNIADKLTRIEYVDPTAVGSLAGIVTRTPQGDEGFESITAWESYERGQSKSTLPKPIVDVIKMDLSARTEAQNQQLRGYFLENVYPRTRPIFDGLKAQMELLNKARTELDTAIPSTMVMADLPQPRETFLLLRGAYDKKGERVVPGVPTVLPPLPPNAPSNRLGLSQWLVDPAHPLTARVTVNRFWQQFFGKGIVKTSNDFGTQGEWPTHPELLDWLACEFMEPASEGTESGAVPESPGAWDVRHIIRLIVKSNTYCQSSRVTPELAARDPENNLLARGPRFRLDAEVVRDTALAASGLLAERIGGRSVKPYQPPGLWEAVGFLGSNTREYKRDLGNALYRRSLYTFWKRTSPPAALTTFDAPSRETCTVRRPRTNTPLQALALMNDEQYVEASRRLAERMLTESGPGTSDRLTYGFRLCTSRHPRVRELDVLSKLYESQLLYYQADRDAALKLLSVGESKRNEALDPSELAAWTMTANLLLNLDETITKE